MQPSMLTTISNEMADAVAGAAPFVVQVQGRRRPASGLVYADGVVVTTAGVLGRGDGLRVGARREYHEPRCVAVDPVHDERPVPAP